MSGATPRYTELASGPKSELDRVFATGEQPSFPSIAGYEFRGFNQPRFMSLLGIRKFVKVFFKSADGLDFGCNTPVEQNGLGADWLPRPNPDNPKRFGFFSVGPVELPRPSRHPEALLLDYGRGHNKIYELSRFLRDYLVRVDAGSDELLLGKAYLVLGPVHLPVGYFLLERQRPIAVEPQLPGG
jgi:hypothetical protein